MYSTVNTSVKPHSRAYSNRPCSAWILRTLSSMTVRTLSKMTTISAIIESLAAGVSASKMISNKVLTPRSLRLPFSTAVVHFRALSAKRVRVTHLPVHHTVQP